MSFLQTYLPLIGRTFLALIFIRSGISKLMDFSGTQETIASVGLPIAAVVTVFTIVFEIAGALSVITGFKARIGATLLLIFLIPTTLIFHNPIADPGELTQFMKNLSIIGGILLVLAYGAGPVSIDRATSGSSSERIPQESIR